MVGVIKYSLIMVSMIPCITDISFVQKYFVKGVAIDPGRARQMEKS